MLGRTATKRFRSLFSSLSDARGQHADFLVDKRP